MAQLQLTGLKPNVTYNVSVRAIGEDGESELSEVLTFTTPSSIIDTINKNTTIKLEGGSIYAGAKTGPGVLFNQNGLIGLFSPTACSFYLSSQTGDAYFAGSITAAAGTIGGFRIGPTSLSATNIVLSSTGGFALGSASQFSVSLNGNMVAQNASITGYINATSGSFSGAVSGASVIGGFISGASISGGQLNINGNASISGYINATSGSFTGGIYGASISGGQLNINGNASITGYINATSGSFSAGIYASVGTIGGFNISSSSLSAGTGTNTVGLLPGSYPFFAGNATPALATFRVNNLGAASALSLYASSGFIAGDFQITGRVYGGAIRGAGTPGVEISSSGIYGYYGNLTRFYLPTDPLETPVMASFTLLESRYTGSGANAVIIAGDIINNNVTIKGDKTAGSPAMIYNTKSGVQTTFTAGEGFYLDDTGKFKFGDANNYISGSSGNLFVTGTIVAKSGSFNGAIYAQSGSFTGNINSTASIYGAALYGGIFQTLNTSGSYIKIDGTNNAISFFNGNTTFGHITPYVSGSGISLTYGGSPDPGDTVFPAIRLGKVYSAMYGQNAGNKIAVGAGVTIDAGSNDININNVSGSDGKIYIGSGTSSGQHLYFSGGIFYTNQVSPYKNLMQLQNNGTNIVVFTSVNDATLSTTGKMYAATGTNLWIDTSDNNGSVRLGHGSASTNNNSILSPAIFWSIGSGGANTVSVATSASDYIMYRNVSRQAYKTEISPISLYSNLSNSISKEKIIAPLIDSNKVLDITPVFFKSILPIDENKKFLGFIAEDIYDKFPELSILDENGIPDYYNINGIVAAMLAVLQGQKVKIDELETRIAALENK